MPRPARPWFRFYVEAMGDPKIRTLTPVHRWLWVAVLGLARQSPEAGYLFVSDDLPHSPSSIADFAGVKEREAREGLREFETRDMIELDMERSCWLVPSFLERQYESDSSTVRTRLSRSQGVSGNENGTRPENRDRTRKQKPPSDYVPTAEHQAFALARGLSLDDEREHWIDWCDANGRTYVNVNSGFSTWLRQAVKFGRGGPPVATLEELATPRVEHVCTVGNPDCRDGFVDIDGRAMECECRRQRVRA